MSSFDELIYGKRPKSRRSLSKGDKQLILRSQRGRCARCGERLRLVDAHFDHKRPRAAGGSDRITNFQAVHPNCHWRKTKQDMKKIAKVRRVKARRATDPLKLGLRIPKAKELGF